ncbi:MAG: DUF721 domain-containing protein [Nitriliruptoraceae bacterium]
MNDRDGQARQRRANAADRDERVYARKRAVQARKRASIERQEFDPAPPTDDDWTVDDDVSDGVQRVTAPVPLTEALETLVRRRGWSKALRSARLWAQWEDVVGEGLVGRCEPSSLERGVLTVRTSSQVWATQLKYMTRHIAGRANEAIGQEVVTKVVIVVGTVGERPERGDA